MNTQLTGLEKIKAASKRHPELLQKLIWVSKLFAKNSGYDNLMAYGHGDGGLTIIVDGDATTSVHYFSTEAIDSIRFLGDDVDGLDMLGEIKKTFCLKCLDEHQIIQYKQEDFDGVTVTGGDSAFDPLFLYKRDLEEAGYCSHMSLLVESSSFD